MAEGTVSGEPVSTQKFSGPPTPPKKGGCKIQNNPLRRPARRSEPLHRKAAARLALRPILTKRVICGGPKFNWILADSGSRALRGKGLGCTAYANSEQLTYKIREAAEFFRSRERSNPVP